MEENARHDTENSALPMEPGDATAENAIAAFDYRAFANILPEMVFVTDPLGRVVFFNQHWHDFTGIPEGTEMRTRAWEATHPEDREQMLLAWEEARKVEGDVEAAFRQRGADGNYRWLLTRAFVYRDPATGALQGWIGIGTDIDDLKRVQEEREDVLSQLSAVLQSATDGIVVSDPQGNILMMNPVALAMHRYTTVKEARKPLGAMKSYFALLYADGSPVPFAEWPMSRVMRGEVFTDYELRVHRLATVPDARDVVEWNAYSGSPAWDKNGKIMLVIVTIRDITERKQMETQRDALLRHVEEAAEKQRRFLREILSSMSEGRLRLCETSDDLPLPLSEEPIAEPVTLERRTIRDLRKQTTAACEAAGLPMERENDLVTAVGEAGMNAVVHAGSGTATVYQDVERGIVQVWISDTGTGISEESLHRATLEKGYTTAGTLGHGFWMMLKTADRVYLLTSPTGTTVVIEQERTPPVPLWMQSFVESY